MGTTLDFDKTFGGSNNDRIIMKMLMVALLKSGAEVEITKEDMMTNPDAMVLKLDQNGDSCIVSVKEATDG